MAKPETTSSIEQGVRQSTTSVEQGVLRDHMTASASHSSFGDANVVNNSRTFKPMPALPFKASDYTHFISLPLSIHSELVDKLFRFQSIILGDCDSNDAFGTMGVDSNNIVKVDVTNIPLGSSAPRMKSPSLSDLGIDKSLFTTPKTFHLTVLMLKLRNDWRIHAAKECLQNVKTELMKFLDNRPLFVRLKGLDCLRGSQDKAQVLYVPVEDNEGRLLRACQIIIDAFVKAGLVPEICRQRKLKLHATVMNTTFRKRRGESERRREDDFFDARGIFEQFGSEQWGDYQICEAHLSQRHVFDSNGYYHCCKSIHLT